MKNRNRHKDATISLPLQVADGRVAGQIVKLGTTGLRGLIKTARATVDTVADGTAAPGLKAGEATVELINVHSSLNIDVAGATAQFAGIYIDADSAYTTTATNNTLVGATLAATAGAGTVEVAIF